MTKTKDLSKFTVNTQYMSFGWENCKANKNILEPNGMYS